MLIGSFREEVVSVPLYQAVDLFEIKPVKIKLKRAFPRKELMSCLKCDRKFRSWDKRVNRICPKCNRTNRKLRASSRAEGESFSVEGDEFSHLNRDPDVSAVYGEDS